MKKVQIVGAGGIGVYLGWLLARAGWDVLMVEAKATKLEAGRSHGLEVDGQRETRVRFVAFADWSPAEGTLVLMCVKTFDNAAVLARLPQRAWLLPVQNGFDAGLEASDHPLEAIAAFVSQCDRDRPATRLTRPGGLYLGGRRALTASQRAALEELAAALRLGGCPGVRVVGSIGPYKAAKLMYNAAISPLAAAAGIDNGELLRDPVAQRLFFALLRENYAILSRRGVALARIGPFHPRTVNVILRIPGLAPAFARFFRPSLRGTYCSMAPDIASGRTEVAAYNGYLENLAQGLACPLNTAILKMLARMKSECLPPHRDLLIGLHNSLGWGTGT